MGKTVMRKPSRGRAYDCGSLWDSYMHPDTVWELLGFRYSTRVATVLCLDSHNAIYHGMPHAGNVAAGHVGAGAETFRGEGI